LRLLLAIALSLVLAAPAAAHVTILPESSRPGETGEFTFRTPNEREDAATVKLEVFVPDGVPVEAEPVEGWTITRIAGGIQWAADEGVSIRPGRTEDFKARLGPLPDRPRLVFKALQYYADGQVVRWIQDPVPDAERPAAVLDLGGGGDLRGDVNRIDEDGGPPWVLIVVGGLVAFFAALWFFLLRA
jgi:periplasmic copper chaperone A